MVHPGRFEPTDPLHTWEWEWCNPFSWTTAGDKSPKRASYKITGLVGITRGNMASSAGLFLLVDDDCSEEEMRKIVKKLKRKFNNCHVTSDEAENASSKRQKRSHNTEHSSSEDADIPTSDAAKTTGKCAKNSCESGNDTSCELCVPKKRGKKEKSAKSKKLTSRLKRIMKHKTGNNQMQVDQTDSYDTDSTSSVDSGIHCDGASAGSAAVLARDKSNIVALDCEFVGVGPTRKSALGRCSVVDYWGRTLCDIYSRPDEPITDYRTRWSGLRKRDLLRAVPFETAQNSVRRLLQDKIVIGHAVHNDFRVLGLRPPRALVRDTARCGAIRRRVGQQSGKQRLGLRNVTAALLGRTIQSGEHCSIEDSRAALDLYKLVEDEWENELAENPSTNEDDACFSDSDQPIEEDFLNDEFWPEDV